MLAPDGRCKTLDAAADGYVRAEALAAVLLHRLPGAASLADAPAWAAAVITASAVNQDGRSSGLTAPNGPAQQEVLRAALAAAGLAPRDVSGLQLHGTGTGLGDPIEVGAAAAVFGSSRSSDGGGAARLPLTLASDKSGVGHTEPAAGLTGTLHALRGAAQRAAQPLLHLRSPNPYLASSLAPLGGAGAMSMPRQPRGAPSLLGGGAGGAAVAGTSSFAFQGSNAHLLLSASACPRHDAGAGAATAPPLQWARTRAYVLPPAHALLHSAAAPRGGDAGGACVFEAPLRHPLLAYLSDHVVGPAPIVPGAAFLEAGLAAGAMLLAGAAGAGASRLGLASVSIVAPLALPAGAARGAWPVLRISVDAASGAAAIASGAGGADHLRGSLVCLAAPASSAAGGAAAPQAVDASFDRECAAGLEPLDMRRLYADLAAAGLRYGPAFRRLRGARAGRGAATAALEPLPGPGAYLAHPAALDSAFQLGAAVRDGAAAGPGNTFVPVAVALFAPGGGEWRAEPATAVASAAPAPRGGPTGRPCIVRHLRICSPAGGVLATVAGLESRAVPHAALLAGGGGGAAGALRPAASPRAPKQGPDGGGAEDLLYEITWAAEEPEAAEPASSAAPAAAFDVAPRGGASATLQLLQCALGGRGGVPGAGHAAVLRHATCAAGALGAGPSPAGDGGALLRELAAAGMLRTAAQEAGGGQAPSVAAAHASALRAADPAAPGKPGFSLLLQPAGAAPVSWDGYGAAASGGARYTPRMRRSAAAMAPLPHQLVPAPRGALGNLVPAPVDVGVPLGPERVLVAVKAVGLNFRDVLNVSGGMCRMGLSLMPCSLLLGP
jgi:acyl transferase domain-containing protein